MHGIHMFNSASIGVATGSCERANLEPIFPEPRARAAKRHLSQNHIYVAPSSPVPSWPNIARAMRTSRRYVSTGPDTIDILSKWYIYVLYVESCVVLFQDQPITLPPVYTHGLPWLWITSFTSAAPVREASGIHMSWYAHTLEQQLLASIHLPYIYLYIYPSYDNNTIKS